MEASEAIVKALTMAVSGERKAIPTWAGNVSTLRAWLRQPRPTAPLGHQVVPGLC